jgi:hypothetical protein
MRVNVRNGKEQVRITPWPAVTLPAPTVWRRQVTTHHGWFHEGKPTGWGELPEELILRDLQHLDCTSIDAMSGFINAHGVLGGTLEDLTPFAHSGPIDPRSTTGTPVADVERILRTARACVNHWLAHLEREDVTEPWRAEGTDDVDADTAWKWFTTALNRGLMATHARIQVATRTSSGDYLDAQPAFVGLYSGMMVQLFNLISERLPVLTCANETCQQRFIRQQGRAQKGISRTEGVLFCSASCAKAQAQREYRRRKSTERQGT